MKRLINFVSIESHDDRTVDDNHRSSHVTKFLEIGQGARILRDVPFLKLYALLRKILFRLTAEHSAVLGINDDAFCHFSPPPWLSAGGQQALNCIRCTANNVTDRIIRINRIRWGILP
jgi:hypothetical protein